MMLAIATRPNMKLSTILVQNYLHSANVLHASNYGSSMAKALTQWSTTQIRSRQLFLCKYTEKYGINYTVSCSCIQPLQA